LIKPISPNNNLDLICEFPWHHHQSKSYKTLRFLRTLIYMTQTCMMYPSGIYDRVHQFTRSLKTLFYTVRRAKFDYRYENRGNLLEIA
jgi:hypothetical protein